MRKRFAVGPGVLLNWAERFADVYGPAEDTDDMKRIAWLTDIHLNFLSPDSSRRFMIELAGREADAVIVTGDVAEADTLAACLKRIAGWLHRPIYFVLGNHDYYRSSIADVRGEIVELCRKVPNLWWLNETGVVQLSPTTALVGHDSWCDGRYGDYAGSSLVLTDFLFIQDLLGIGKEGRRQVLERLAEEAAVHFLSLLPPAFGNAGHVILATHVPPFAEACCHDGRAAERNALPYYGCKAVGDVLRQIMSARPDKKLTVLCGHTHCGMDVEILPNLRVLVGEAEYGKPVVQRILEIAPLSAVR